MFEPEEKRDTICYGYITKKNKDWLLALGKKLGKNLSSTLDMILDDTRSRQTKYAKRKK